jgi:hypothetical protein
MFLRLWERGYQELPSPALAEEFCRLWEASSGCCNPWGSLRKLIVPLKKKIAAWVLDEARKNGWEHGLDRKDGHLW